MKIQFPKLEIEYNGKYYFMPLDEIIFIKVEGRYCNFYLQKTSYTNIRTELYKVWDQIETIGKGYDHQLAMVGRSTIINMGLVIDADVDKDTVTLLRGDSPTITPMPEIKKFNHPEEIMVHVNAIGHRQNEDKQECLNHDITVPIEKTAAKEIAKTLRDDKIQKVLGDYVMKHELLVSIDSLNKDCPMETGHEYVDLGLPSGIKWASGNLGDYEGVPSFYAWGELYTSSSYNWEHYSAYPKGDRPKELNMTKDVARKCWGGNWRIPTNEDFQELMDYCSFTWCSNPKGCLVKGPNGNRIFLPAYGYKHNNERNEVRGMMGRYWCTKALLGEHAIAFSFKNNDDISDMHTDGVDVSMTKILRCSGLSIRPVLTEPSNASQSKKKVLLIKSVGEESDSPFSIPRWNPEGWDVLTPQYPLSPKVALDFFKDYCDKHHPDVIIGICSGSFFAKQLKGYPRICLDPNCLPSDALELHNMIFKNKQVDQELIDEYRKLEMTPLMARGEEKCCAVFSNPKKNDEYDSWEHIDVEPWDEHDMGIWRDKKIWGNTFLYPLLDRML